jgi:hypothetical protein
MSDDRVTTGEIYRTVQRIEALVIAQNSRVRKLEDDAIRIRTLWAPLWALVVVVVGFGVSWLKHKLGF